MTGRWRREATVFGRALGALLLVGVLLGIPPAANSQANEYVVKAAFLYNFLRFVEWPEKSSNNSTFVIGIVGEDPFGDTLDNTVRGRQVNGRTITVRRLKATDDLGGCHIVFAGNSERTDIPRILKQVQGAPVLTVGESDRFLRQGGMVNFVLDDNQVKIVVNLKAAEDARLKLSAKLLTIARVVGTGSTGGKN